MHIPGNISRRRSVRFFTDFSPHAFITESLDAAWLNAIGIVLFCRLSMAFHIGW